MTAEQLACRHADALAAWRRCGEVYPLFERDWELVTTTSGYTREPLVRYLFALPGGGFCQVSTFANAAHAWHYSVGRPRKWHV